MYYLAINKSFYNVIWENAISLFNMHKFLTNYLFKTKNKKMKVDNIFIINIIK